MSNEQPCDFSGGRALEVLGKAPASAEPCKGSFDNPASRQQLEAFDAMRSLDDLDRPRPAMGECSSKLFAAINTIGKDMPQLGEAVSQALQQRDGAMDVLHIGRVNMNCEQEAISIGDDMPFAPVDTFARVKTSRSAGLRRRSTLTVDDRCSWLRLTSELPSRLPNQSFDDLCHLPLSRQA
jgi:hypothetical protein